MHRSRLIILGVILLLTLTPAWLTTAVDHNQTNKSMIHLRRATFDPLTESTPTTIDRTATASTLRLIQLDSPPTEDTPTLLAQAGYQPLVYIPDQTYLVRVVDGGNLAMATQTVGVRWLGKFANTYKLAESLDAVLQSSSSDPIALQIMLSSDADLAAVTQAIGTLGGNILSQRSSMQGMVLRVDLPSNTLSSVISRDDVLWVEQALPLRLHNDQARAIVGITATRQELSWLTGAGQIVAVTDTGLDRQGNLSSDFSGRVVAGFAPNAMSSGCSTNVWSDYGGHGTHVSGTILGSGTLSPSGINYAGMAPAASLVVQSVASASSTSVLDCLPNDDSFLSKAYNAGARVQNGSFGSSVSGAYDSFAQLVDEFLWNNPQHLFVVSAGNSGEDTDNNGVVDSDSMESPAVAKNVIAVGASENTRPPSGGSCAAFSGNPAENYCWNAYLTIFGTTLANDFISNNANGMAAFSARGPADDGRIKPDIVAPGTNIISTRSHQAGATYDNVINDDYAYLSGTSMAAPVVSGAAALVRQWLSVSRSINSPSAALVRALLLNGATDLTPGQYGTGSVREIPAAWPNNVQGWGRLNVADSVELSDSAITLIDNSSGLQTNGSSSSTIDLTSGQTVRITLAWTDYPGTPLANKALVNDLDLEVVAPGGTTQYGNQSASLGNCRSANADRCNTAESISFTASSSGTYTVRVKGYSVASGPQPYAVVISQTPIDPPSSAPTLQLTSTTSIAANLSWSSVSTATSYTLERSSNAAFSSNVVSTSISGTSTTITPNSGTYWLRVQACNSAGCGPWSNSIQVTISTTARRIFLPFAVRANE
jgi:subtilisin family serine protease